MNNIAKIPHRLVSGMIDFLILFLPNLYSIYNLSQSDQPEVILDRGLYAITFFVVYGLIMIFVNSYMISKFGGTIGKILTGLQIVNPEGNKISFWRAILRNYLGYTISGMLLWLGFIWVIVDKERQGWHDMIANTYVVVKDKSRIVIALSLLVLLIVFGIFLISFSVDNFANNSNLYTEMLWPTGLNSTEI